jgi:hypothetical protein
MTKTLAAALELGKMIAGTGKEEDGGRGRKLNPPKIMCRWRLKQPSVVYQFLFLILYI